MRRGFSTFMLIIMLIAGVGFFVYPDVASWWNGRSQRGMVVLYYEEVAQMREDQRDSVLRRAQEYNAARPEISISDPFADVYDLPATYLETLNVAGTMARIEIPAISVNLPILHGTSTSVLDVAAGHLQGTHMPIGGYDTHAVITAHSGLSNARMFTGLLDDNVGIGTMFFITVLDQRLAYVVDEMRTVLPHEVDALRVYPGRDLVTLITCTPLAVNSHRLLVRGTRVPYTPGMAAEIEPYISVIAANWRLFTTFVIFMLFLLVFATYQIIRIIRGRHSKMLEKKIELLERELILQRDRAAATGQALPAYAAVAGLDHEYNEPKINQHVNPNTLRRREARERSRSAANRMRSRAMASMAVLLIVAGAGIFFYPRMRQQFHDRYTETVIAEWSERLPEYREFVFQRWENERTALWNTISELPIATNGDITISETGHIFVNHATHVAFGATATPDMDYSGYLTLGGVPVASNGYITVSNISVSPSGSLNISARGSVTFDNLSLAPTEDIRATNGDIRTANIITIGNYPIGDIAVEDDIDVIFAENYNVDMVFNFDPYRDPLAWIVEEMHQYNRMLYETNQSGLISLESTEEVDYSVVENGGFSEEMLGFITIPRMNIELPIFAGSSHGHMLRGAAHLTQSSLPVGGINTNSVITAHRGLSSARMFRDIQHLQVGDRIYVTNFYEKLVYVMFEYRIIEPDDINAVKIIPGRDILTLMSCHPYRINTQRILVFAERST